MLHYRLYGSPFPPSNKKKRLILTFFPCNCEVTSCNLDFSPNIYSQLQFIKSELRDTNLQLWNSELEVGIALYYNSNYLFSLAIFTCFSQMWLYIMQFSPYNLQLQVYTSQFWGIKLWNANSQLQEKSQNFLIEKLQLPYLFLFNGGKNLLLDCF